LVPALAAAGVAYGMHAEKNTIAIVAGLLAFLFAVPTMIYVGIGLAFGDRAVVIDGLGPADALDRSWSLAKGNRVQLFVFLFVTTLFRLAGLLLCCIGVVLTRAIVDVGTTEAYMLATQSNTDAWVLPKLP
jgi:membrane-anchored glycerophosphoryl diester phosphodiesterase (GDPDase)